MAFDRPELAPLRAVKNAPDPDTCPDEGAANPCGHHGCDGAGACVALPGASTVVTPLRTGLAP